MAEIGKRIKTKRLELGMTQEELASKLGYKSKTTIAKIENGTNDITQSRVVDFANILNTSVSYLMGWEEDNALTPRDRRDIKKDLDDIMEKIENGEDGPLRYNGQEIDKESLDLLKDAIGMSLRHLKIINKEKYNPNKNKK